ncbi:energy-coupling factor transporter transmembrane component T family protein [Thermodesulforhabdus norvegica]|uniref:Biotin transport system permease protein n=1 Tax=Thermodesulforhabdus norvegica TaxID=39841 RepID=A0A1I4SAY4_9BACT|nr:energy-coupling factor transporter transmembrane component T [Thermodesulforhabdus norvegica]SFM61433.1 biotin transport system permease protein [Thermodesulforhabdus norvegica]
MLCFIRPSASGADHELIFHYIPSEGWLYRWDARCKWLSFMTMSTLVLKTGPPGLAVFTLTALTVFATHKPILRHFRMPATWWYLLLLILLMNALKLPPDRSIFSTEGIISGCVVCWKIMTLISFAVILTATTSPSETVQAINSFFRFLPLHWNHRLTTMITLTLRFVPYLMGEYRKIELAARARTGSSGPGIIIRHVMPAFVRRSLTIAEDIATALQARGYREDLPVKANPLKKQDIFALIAIMVFAILTFAIDWALGAKLS